MNLLLAFLPYEALPLLVVVGGFAVMFGLVSGRAIVGYIVGFAVAGAVFEALWPVLGQLFSALSIWWQITIVVVGSILILRMLLALVFGAAVANHVVSLIVYDVFFRIPARMLGGLVALMFGLSQVTRDRR
jgi:hypothetical protein